MKKNEDIDFNPAGWLGEVLFGFITILIVTYDRKNLNRNNTLEFTRKAGTPSAKRALANGIMAEVHGQS